MNAEEAKAASIGEKLDYAKLGFKCGIEIHQQLDTRKLFSLTPSEVVDPEAVKERAIAQYTRKLRIKGGETGQMDSAVLAEAKRNRSFRYIALAGNSSLVELDEEPPVPMSRDALDVTLQFAALCKSRFVDEVQVMRKTVIDGSNTGGFQRTALVATGGVLDAELGPVKVWIIAVEEDSARKLAEIDGLVTYTLDRLGIPLIEIATAPDIISPAHAQQTAARIGALLRSTKRVRRGLGTIRQDLNVSVAVGDRVEIKGCQDLRAIPAVIDGEIRRQLWMFYVKSTLLARGFSESDIATPIDVTKCFQNTSAKMIQSTIKSGGVVLALKLPRWKGLIEGVNKTAPRMGREFADHAKVRAGVKGVFHGDEMPAYGISQAEIDAVVSTLNLGAQDSYVLVVEKASVATQALAAVADRARAAIHAPAQEVRACQPDDTTRFMRPLPGAARMYPETDVPPMPISAEYQKQIRSNLPPLPEVEVASLQKIHGISFELAFQLQRDDAIAEFEHIVTLGATPNLAATLMLQTAPTITNWKQVYQRLPEVFDAIQAQKITTGSLEKLLPAIAASPKLELAAVIQNAGVAAADDSEVDAIIAKIVEERIDFVRERGIQSMGPLMGPAMKELRGKVDGNVLSDKLRAEISKRLA